MTQTIESLLARVAELEAERDESAGYAKDETNVFRIEYGDLHDSYTAQKAQIAALTRQRDLAVEALEDASKKLRGGFTAGALTIICEALSTIKESEVADGA